MMKWLRQLADLVGCLAFIRRKSWLDPQQR